MRIYRLLLHLYPASFRTEYGAEMCAILARRLRESSSCIARCGIWMDTVLEMPFSACAAHWDILGQDLRYTTRTLARTPGFTTTAIVVVAIGVGANAAAFSVADFVLIKPLPFAEPDRLVDLWERLPGYFKMEPSPANYRDWKQMTTAFDSMGAFHPISVNMIGQGNPERLEGSAVTADLLPTLGVQPLLGRLFTDADSRDGAARTVLLSYPLWQSVFGSDPGVLGRNVILDNAVYTIVGVMPSEFSFPSRDTELWTARQFQTQEFEDRNNNYLEVVARLRPGISPAQAQADMDVVADRLERQYPRDNARHGATVLAMRDELPQQSRMLLLALCGASLCVLLIACSNLASLLLARSLVRRKELAVRSALGAGRERLVRQLITESAVLAVLGGGLGVLLAQAALPLLTRLVPNALPVPRQPSIDARVLVVAALLTALTGLVFGIIPALRACRGNNLSGLREGARSGGARKEHLRSALVVAEVMASVVLLISAGLLMRALWRVSAIDPGFKPEGVLTLSTALPMPKYDKTLVRQEFYKRVLDDVKNLPGVSRAAYISGLPMVWRGGIWPVGIPGEPQDRSDGHTASLRFVSAGFFDALEIPLRAGRDIAESDTADSVWVAVVSESFARRYWPGQNPLDHHFEFGLHDRTIVGVVGDIRVRGLERNSEPQVYLSYQQVHDGDLVYYAPKDLVIRSASPPEALMPSVRAIVRSIDADQPISDVRTMDDIVGQDTASRSVQVRALWALAAVAFLLAAVGIHGLLSFAVSQRSQEIGVRMALGARSTDILGMILRHGFLLAATGIAPGLLLAYAAGRSIEALLADIEPGDPVTFLSAAALCILMTGLGLFLPAMRALRTNPIAVIRAE